MYFAKKTDEETATVLVNTSVYACESPTCNSWMRKDFATEDLNCPMCGTGMREETRELPQIRTDYNPFRYN